MTKVAVATTSGLAASAAREIAAAGGNAVDCAIAAALVSMNTEPGVCALAGGAYVTVWAPDQSPVTIDGNHAVPGLGLSKNERRLGARRIEMEYGGGVATDVGAGSVAVPGAVAALDLASSTYGALAWQELFGPAIAATRDGFPLPVACHYYLRYSGKAVFGRSEDGYSALHHADGSLRGIGDTIFVAHLADSLEAIASGGADVFYRGHIGEAICQHVRGGDGALTLEDLGSYRAIPRESMVATVDHWQIATNPPPAVGGAVLTAMLLGCRDLDGDSWDAASLQSLIQVHRACLDFRRDRLDVAADVGEEAAALIAAARDGRLVQRWTSASTVHTSAVDANGLGCSITASAGYGSGEMPAGTGLWLNNGLGELELHPEGVGSGIAGERLPSNMAPSVARARGKVLAIGTPGADRITTALHQVLVNRLEFKMPLEDAIAHPRLHIDTSGHRDRLMAETGLDLPDTDLPVRIFPELNMYFGGVGAALYDDTHGFEVASDPRRAGGTVISD